MTQIPVTSVGLDADGVRLISPADEEFDSLVDALSDPEWTQILKDATPSIVIVSNSSARKIVGLSTVFTAAGGRHAGRTSVFFVAPDAIAHGDVAHRRSSKRGILPGCQRMIGFDFVVPCREGRQGLLPEDRAREDRESTFYFPQVRNWIERTAQDLSQARHVHVSIDAAVFDDGLMVGEGRSGLGPHFVALVQARQHAYTAVLQRIEEGQQAEDAVRDFVRPDGTETPDGFDRERFVSNEAKNAVASLLRRYGGGRFPDILRRAILPQPFALHR